MAINEFVSYVGWMSVCVMPARDCMFPATNVKTAINIIAYSNKYSEEISKVFKFKMKNSLNRINWLYLTVWYS